MAKRNDKNNGGVTATVSPEVETPLTEVRFDDSNAEVCYSAIAQIRGGAEEFVVDFSRGLTPGSKPQTAIFKSDAKIIMSPWAAKRLAIELSQSVQQYEEAFGPLEIDARKRVVAKDSPKKAKTPAK